MRINHGGLSGGKDSTALMLWMVYESGYPRQSLRFSFCDTGNETEQTYNHLRMLSERVHPIDWIKPERDFYELARHKHRWPSPHARFCTQMLKLEPTRRYLNALAEGGADLLLHTGVRRGESPERAKLPEREPDPFFAYPCFRPLLDWTLEDVWAIHKRYGIPRNPMYDLGCTRVGCMPCVMSDKHTFRVLGKHFPERVSRIRELEPVLTQDGRYASFVNYSQIPERHRSVTTRTAQGPLLQVPSIDDVVRWSLTTRGGKQYELDFEGPANCTNISGLCE